MFDVNRFVGAAVAGTHDPAMSSMDMVQAMDDEGIENAVVWHIAQKELSVHKGNEFVLELIRESSRLFGLHCLLPELCRECGGWNEIFELLKMEQFAGVVLFPGPHRYYLSHYSFPSLFGNLSAEGIPVFLSMYHSGIDWKDVISLLESYPKLTCVLTDLGIYGQERKFRILLENFPNVYLETSYLSLGWGVLEELVCTYGTKRFLFGSGFPMRMPRASSFHLRSCPLPEPVKRMIIGGNISEILNWRKR